jgi:glycosyltransferase involved in cell wall biosynthesis
MGTLRGRLDRATWNSLDGWAYDAETPGSPVELEVLDNDQPIARFLANRYRADLEKVGLKGHCSFSLRLPLGWSGMTERVITVRRVSDGAILPGSPMVPELPQDAATRMQHSLEQLVRAATAEGVARDPGEHEALLQLLANTAERMLRARLEHGEPAALDVEAFYQRWKPLLENRSLPVRRQAADRPPELRRRALVIDDALPRPGRSAREAAMLDHIGALRRLGYEVLLAPQDMASDPAAEAALEERGIQPCLGPYYASVEEVLRRNAGMLDLVWIQRLGNFMQYGGMARHHAPRARLVYGAGTLSHLHLSRRAAVDELGEIMRHSRAAKASELIAARLADSVVTHSPYDAGLLAKDLPRADIHAIPWSVAPRPVATPFGDRRDIAFLADDAEDATLDAVLWLMEGIMPKLRARNPDIRCFVLASQAGARLPRGSADGLVFLEPEADPSAVLEQVRATVAPLRYGAGLKGRVLQSLAAGIPCICSPVAAEGLALPPALEACIGSTPQRLAELMLRLHEEEAENAACSAAGLSFITGHFDPARIDAALARLLHHAGPPLQRAEA